MVEAQGSSERLHAYWVKKFLNRHPELKDRGLINGLRLPGKRFVELMEE
jgi:hypothetical protein